MDTASALVTVHGRVQGVGFRFYVREQAIRRGIKGWVRNIPDGGVEIFAQGEKEGLDVFIEKVKRGPTFGHVESFELNWVESEKKFEDFSIKF